MFKQIFENNSMPMAISTVADGRFVEVNRAFGETTGFTRDEVIGRTSADLNLFANPEIRKELRVLSGSVPVDLS